MFLVVGRVGHDGDVDQERLLEQAPDVLRRVDLLHLHFCVDVAVVQEVDVRLLHLPRKSGRGTVGQTGILNAPQRADMQKAAYNIQTVE